MLVGQSQLVVHTTVVGGKQWPTRQMVPVVHVVSAVHWARQVASTQSEPVGQSPALLQVPVTRVRHRPAWQE
jgi:hypothetical protein